MNHREIIQEILNTCKQKNYLEIGVAKGQNFVAIIADYKVGVDPIQPSMLVTKSLNDTCVYHAMISDEFFMNLESSSVKYGTILIDGLHEYEQTYRDIMNALSHLSEDGVIVVPNCKPTNEIMALPPHEYALVDPEYRKMITGKSWTGDVWKAIVHLRSFHKELFVFTLDCAFGCAVITKAKSNFLLKFSLTEIKKMDFGDLSADYIGLLNLKPPKYLYSFLLQRNNRRKTSNYNFYVEDIENYVKLSSRDYYIDEIPGVNIIENGIILPAKRSPDHIAYAGGVCDANGNFVDGHRRWKNQCDAPGNLSYAYSVQNEIEIIKETVVYGGVVFNHFGQMILEYLSRMWWFLENRDSGYKFVFISSVRSIEFLEFFLMLGLREKDIIILYEPMRFDAIIVPDQSSFASHGFTSKAMEVYNAIRDSVEPAPHEKIYFTRSKLDPKTIIGEEYFENHYRAIGYEVVSPERLSVREQVALMAGAKELVCTGGTLAHHILFCRDGIKLTVLSKTTGIIPSQFWINQARKARCTYIDVSVNFLPDINFCFCYLFMPTVFWKQYIKDQLIDIPYDNHISLHELVFEYITNWAKLSLTCTRSAQKALGRFSLADVIIGIHKYLLGNGIDENKKKWLKSIWEPVSTQAVAKTKAVNSINTAKNNPLLLSEQGQNTTQLPATQQTVFPNTVQRWILACCKPFIRFFAPLGCLIMKPYYLVKKKGKR